MKHDPFIAALLSLFFPGTGQLYLGRRHIGVALLAVGGLLWFGVPTAAWVINIIAALEAYQFAARTG